MKKIAYIIPGSGEYSNESAYKKIGHFFKNKGIKPVPVKIKWDYKTMTDYVNQFKKIANKNPDYVLGFSFGAMIAFITANDVKPKCLILCSLSPWFKEDLPYIPKRWRRYVGKKLWKDLNKYSFNKIVKNNKLKVILLVGEKEGKECIRRAKLANKKLEHSKLITIEKTRHKMSDERYLNKIKEVIMNLN